MVEAREVRPSKKIAATKRPSMFPMPLMLQYAGFSGAVPTALIGGYDPRHPYPTP